MAREGRARTPDGHLNEIGGRVRERLLQLKIKHMELCGRIAYNSNSRWVPDRQATTMIVRGTRSVTTVEIFLLAEALECDVCWLLRGSGTVGA